MSDMENQLALLTSREIAAGRHDAERMSEFIASLTESLALACAVAAASAGKPDQISELLEGVSQHLFTTAAAKAPIATFLTGLQR